MWWLPLALLAAARPSLAGSQAPFWPQPKAFTSGTDRSVLAPPESFVLSVLADQPAADLVRAALGRLRARLFPHVLGSTRTTHGFELSGLEVRVKQSNVELGLGVNESYTLTVPTTGVVQISAETVFGAYHGLETFSQLVAFDFDDQTYAVHGAPWKIEDAPRFPHREVLIDTSRHFLPVPAITSLIDSMAMAKVNVLHWHIIDDPSFPAASRVHPELAQKGAYSSAERYTWAEMSHVVEFARARGVRVVPEFDMPAHTGSWSKAHPELFPPKCKNALDPANEDVYPFIGELLKDWSEVFTDSFVHLGTDELPTSCWNNTQDLAYMKSLGLKTLDDLFGHFVGRVVAEASKVGKHAILWDESIIRTTAPSGAVIQIWHAGSGILQKAIDAGHDAVFSPDGPWYLDGLGTTWETMYKLDPENRLKPGPGRVLGGGGEMWGETVDPSDLENTVWPRMAAIAERLWSPAEALAAGPPAAKARLEAFRCLMLSRGVRTGPVGGKGRDAPPGPGGCAQAGKFLPDQSPPIVV